MTMLDDIITIGRTQFGKPYRLGGSWNAGDSDPPFFDCSEFTEWVCLRAGAPVRLAEASYLQFWQCKDAGRIISVEQAIVTKGALLFSFRSAAGAVEPPRTNAAANAMLVRRHVGFSAGNGRTVEAMDTDHGVVDGPATTERFTHGGLIPGISYSGGTPPPPPPPSGGIPGRFRPRTDLPWLQKGATGDRVKELQFLLIFLGAGELAGWGATSKFGDVTERAVRAFQQRVRNEYSPSMVVDGLVGPTTWGWLYAYAGQ